MALKPDFRESSQVYRPVDDIKHNQIMMEKRHRPTMRVFLLCKCKKPSAKFLIVCIIIRVRVRGQAVQWITQRAQFCDHLVTTFQLQYRPKSRPQCDRNCHIILRSCIIQFLQYFFTQIETHAIQIPLEEVVGRWKHYAVTKDPNNGLNSVYIDGRLVWVFNTGPTCVLLFLLL